VCLLQASEEQPAEGLYRPITSFAALLEIPGYAELVYEIPIVFYEIPIVFYKNLSYYIKYLSYSRYTLRHTSATSRRLCFILLAL
jgi:hypothetical protein